MLLQVLRTDTLAVWAFLPPTVLREAEAWLKRHGLQQGFAEGAHLNLQQLRQLQFDMGDDAKGVALVQFVYQCHGMRVHVPAGWMHAVVNVRPCIKLAWQVYNRHHLLDYVLSWQYIGSQFTHVSNAPDYMNVMRVVSKLVMKHMSVVR